MVSNNDIRELVPFNLLRNSRADDELAYWTSSGIEADGENGASGTASFKCIRYDKEPVSDGVSCQS